MALKPSRVCRQPGCPHLTQHSSGYCPEHLKADRRRLDRQRGTAGERGYDGRWRRYRRRFLAEHPLCVVCRGEGRVAAAVVVDHVRPHRGDMVLFWEAGNHQALCKRCHDQKTAREDGAFGNAVR